MSEERRRILAMLSQGKISAAEAENLLDALAEKAGVDPFAKAPGTPPADPKYLRVLVDGNDGHGGGKVNVRVPFNLIRAGVRLAALLPTGVYDQMNKALKESGFDVDVSKLKAEDLQDLVQHLRDLQVDVEGGKGDHGGRVRVFCE